MKTKMFMSMLVIALAAALVGGATMAIFTDEAVNAGNTFTAGTVIADVGVTTLEASAGNMAPGDTKGGSFTVTNNGTLELRFNVSYDTAGDLFAVQGDAPGNTPAIVTLTANYENVVLLPDESITVEFEVELPITAGNQYQDDSGTVDFTIDAEQTAHNPLI